MSDELNKRIATVREAAKTVTVSLEDLTPELNKLAHELCELIVGQRYGKLIRYALAIKKVDKADLLTREHLQEAAQHLVLEID